MRAATITKENFKGESLDKFPEMSWWIKKHGSLKAICFDMDGTLLDSEPLHAEALWQMVSQGRDSVSYKEHHLKNADDLHEQFVGMCDQDVYQELVDSGLWSDESSMEDFIHFKNGQLTTHMEQSLLEKVLRPEALVFLDFLKDQGIKIALVSASQKVVVESFVSRLGLGRYFDVVHGAEDTAETKPSPMPYQSACQKMGVLPVECMAFEDSSTGLQSATDAGLNVVKALWFS
jgi:HAD superfamily hydrolase (TIGR01509 family)